MGVLLFNFSNDIAHRGLRPRSGRRLRQRELGGRVPPGCLVRAALADRSVHGWYTIDASSAGCAYTTWASQAARRPTARGESSAYQYVVYAFPQATSCGWAGLTYLPGTSSWINGAMTLRVVSHEVSHNLGVHHASTLACTTGSSPARAARASTAIRSQYGTAPRRAIT